ncbi:MAG: NrfD/PsrC family molybdoenzyme membrane anchor subunit, partial [bacterium]
AYFSWIWDKEKSKKLALIGVPLALAVSLYSGFVLLQMKAHTLWHSALIPVLFSVSAIISGIALIILVAILTQVEKEVIERLGKFLVWFIALDLLLVIVEIFTLFNGHQEAVELARLLLVGAYAPLFLGLYVILGLIVPLFVLTRKELTLKAESIASMLVLIGILAMRYVVVLGGQYFPLS